MAVKTVCVTSVTFERPSKRSQIVVVNTALVQHNCRQQTLVTLLMDDDESRVT